MMDVFRWNISRLLIFFLLVSCLLLIWAYYPAISGGFVFDDEANIVKNTELQIDSFSLVNFWQAAWSGDSGPLGRPVAMFSFAVNWIITGLDPLPMKITNLVIHWLTGINLFFISLLILKQARFQHKDHKTLLGISALIVILWLVHPINLTSVAYIVQRMTSLSTFFVTLAILIYLRARIDQQTNSGQWLITLPLLMVMGVLGVFSKENAVLLPVYLFVIEYFVFGFKAAFPKDRSIIKIFFILVLIFPAIVAIGVLLVSPDFFLNAYQHRDFTLEERLLTQARVLMWYLRMILLPNIAQMTLYHDGIRLSTSLFEPLTTVLSIIAIVGLILAAFLLRTYTFIGLGILWFFGGHLLESTILPLEIAYEHRNYLPSYGIIFSLIVGIYHFSYTRSSRLAVSATMAVIAVVVLSVVTHTRAEKWSGNSEVDLIDALNHPESPRANIIAGNTYSALAKQAVDPQARQSLIQEAEKHFDLAVKLKPASANALLSRMFMYYEHQLNMPDDLLDEIGRNLRYGYIDATTINALHSFTKCKIDGFCTLDNEKYLEIMDAAFNNPHIPNTYASNLLRKLAEFYQTVLLDYETPILLTKRAIELNPKQIGIRLELVHYLANAGYVGSAGKELEKLKDMDMLNQYVVIIEEWESSLNQVTSKN